MEDGQTNNLWALKTVEDIDRALQTIDNYNDSISSRYNYDSKVPNFKRIKKGDNVLLIDKNKILGFAKIEDITVETGVKVIRRCPECKSTTIDIRKNKLPKYRCNKGHVFENPKNEVVEVQTFSAHYENKYTTYKSNAVSLHDIRPYYTSGYNQNMSMQILNSNIVPLFPEALYWTDTDYKRPNPNDGNLELIPEAQYRQNEHDERDIVFRQIRERRGQHKFRSDLLSRYGTKCMVTGCEILDIIEAAHINPYRGINDNHLGNGLLLRSDIHTLFDLNLLGIHPDTLKVHLDKGISKEYAAFEQIMLNYTSDKHPSMDALKSRWKIFLNRTT